MTQCERLSDRMPAVAHGSEWSPGEAAHLAECADCAAEWKVVAAAGGLGAGVTLDLGKISELLRGRLASEPARGRVRSLLAGRPARWAMGLAAAALLVVAVGITVDRRGDRGAVVTVLSELDGLSPSELEAVFDDFAPGSFRPSTSVSGLGDLTADELERILSGWES